MSGVRADHFLHPDWPAPPGVRALITTRHGGVSAAPYASFNLGSHVGDDPARVGANRARLASLLPAAPCWLEQVHGTDVIDLGTLTSVAAPPRADAALARRAGVVCAVLTADCLPVLLCDAAGSVVAAAHAGWRGLLAGVLERTVAAMAVPAGSLMAYLGPAIGPESFEVGDEVRAAFVAAGEEAEAAFKPLHADILGGRWRNRHVLVLPLSGASTVAHTAAELGRGSVVDVRTTPQVTRPADAWGFINGTWARIRELLPARGSAPTGVRPSGSPPVAAPAQPPAPPPAATTPPLAMRPMPAVPTSRQRSAEPPLSANLLDRYVHQLGELTGMVSCCVFELASGRALAHAGATPGADDLANHGTELLASIAGTCRAMGLGHAIPDAAITLGAHHLLLRAVPKHPGLALHAVLDKTHANLTLARLQVQRMDAIFDEPTA